MKQYRLHVKRHKAYTLINMKYNGRLHHVSIEPHRRTELDFWVLI
jgi:hypothetical protein